MHSRPSIKDVVSQMDTPAPPHIVSGLFSRIKEIERDEVDVGGSGFASDCRSFIEGKVEVKWMDVLVAAYMINGGVILREPGQWRAAAPPASSASSASAAATPRAKPVRHAQPAIAHDGVETTCLTEGEIQDIESMVKSMGLDAST